MVKNKFTRIPSDILPTGVCELSVSYRRAATKRIKVSSASEVVAFAREYFFTPDVIEYVEMFYVLFIDRSNQIYAWKQISVGGITATFTDPKLIFQTALLCHATQLILIHNHPSGNTQPSLADTMMTKKIKEGGELLEIKILDHLILTKVGFYSFADEGKM